MSNQPRLLKPQQSRSQQTLDRILHSSTELIAEVSYADVTISQIAQRAKISVGGFYSRFENKEALFIALKNRFVQDTHQQLAVALAAKDEPRSLEHLLKVIVTSNAQLYNQYRGVLIAMHLKVRILGSPSDSQKTAAYNADLVAKLEELLMAKRREISHRQPRVAIRIAIACISSMLKDAIVFGNLDQYPAPKNQKTVVRHVTNVVHSYLSAKSP